MQDKTITCKCGKEFVFTAKDQEFYKRMVDEGKFQGPYTEPKRCNACRIKKKEAKKLQEIRDNSPFKGILDEMKGKHSDPEFVSSK